VADVERLVAYRRCVERIEENWEAFLVRRGEHLAQRERFGSVPEKATEQILAALFSGVLDWPPSYVNYQLERADIVLTSPGVRWVVVEAKRPGHLAWHRAAINDALAQACGYADEQKVRSVAISDGHMLYAADRVNGGLRDRVYVDLTAATSPTDLWWLSVYGIYQHRDDVDGAELRLLPEAPLATDALAVRSDSAALLHPKYRLPAHCFAYVENATDPKTWKLPYLTADGSVDLNRLPGAITAVVKSFRGRRVAIPEAAMPDVLLRLARAAKAAGKLDGISPDASGDCYQLLVIALDQQGRLGDV
jgi:hypothetical protein